MNLNTCLVWTESLLAMSLLIQSFEMRVIAKSASFATHPWAWQIVGAESKNWPRILKPPMNTLMGTYFEYLVIVQIFLSLLLFTGAKLGLVCALILTCVSICFRFRGVFNGGSDYMTITVLLGLLFVSVASTDNTLVRYGFFYIAFQCSLSYFIAGIVKIRTPAWRSGLALQAFIKYSNYPVPIGIRNLSENKLLVFVASWFVMAWECAFPLVWLRPTWALAFLVVAFVFHMGVFLCFGLNRFIFAWLASYPSLLFAVHYVH
jgi:hypothetical protein